MVVALVLERRNILRLFMTLRSLRRASNQNDGYGKVLVAMDLEGCFPFVIVSSG